MSYDTDSIYRRDEVRSAAKHFADANAKIAADDLKRVRFLEALKVSGVKVNGWTREFIDGCARQTRFSRPQRTVIDRLFHLHGKKVKL